MNTDLLWSKVLSSIKEEVNSVVYSTWFQNTKLYNLSDNIATIMVPMNIHKKHLSETYENLIISTLFKFSNIMYQIKYILEDEISNEKTLINNDNNNLLISNNVIPTYKHSSNLNKNYNFENYVVGNSNIFGHKKS